MFLIYYFDSKIILKEDKNIMNEKYYWGGKNKRASIAKKHTQMMEAKYSAEIKQCISNSTVFEGMISSLSVNADDPAIENVFVTPVTTEDMILHIYDQQDVYGDVKRLCALNFASYTNPGGGFLKGSRAQEESLCHASFLYNVLSNPGIFDKFYAKNRATRMYGLYSNRALYSPDILFESHDHRGYVPCDIITCAAPNRSAILKYMTGNGKNPKYKDVATAERDIKDALRDRIEFIYHIVERFNQLADDDPAVSPISHLILGAFGCGVFENHVEDVATFFRDIGTKYQALSRLHKIEFPHIIFAIPTIGNHDYTWDVFCKTLLNTGQEETKNV